MNRQGLYFDALRPCLMMHAVKIQKIAGGLLQALVCLFELQNFISIPSVETSWLVHVDCFCKVPMDESSCDIALH
jgi:hypothetical protein